MSPEGPATLSSRVPRRGATRRRARRRSGAPGSWIPLALLLAAACAPEPGPIDLGRPPVVLILLDALHAKHLSHLGNARDTSPNLDALARQGFSFPAAFAPAPYTLATVSSILTGRLPDAHGLVDSGARLGDRETTLAELLSSAGYRTCAAVGNLNGSSVFGCDQGFDEYVEVFRAEDGRSADVVYGEDRYHFARAEDYPPLVERFLAGDDGRPLLLYLHILEPHEPYSPPEPFRGRYLDPAYDGPFKRGDSTTLIEGRRGTRPFSAADREAVEALYDANLAHVDAVVGQLLEQLDAAGILDEALVIVTSDHGEAFWQHGKQGHNTTLYDEMLQVPLIVRFPVGRGPALAALPESLVSPMDILPSVCDWLGLPLPETDLDGVSLTPLWFGRPHEERVLWLRSHHKQPWFGLRTLDRKTVMVSASKTAPERVEHFRLRDDPAEAAEASAQHPEEVAADVLRIQRHFSASVQSRAERGLVLREAELEMLRNLGYTGEDD